MILGNKNNTADLNTFIPHIKKNMDQWQLLTITGSRTKKIQPETIIKNSLIALRHHDGLVYSLSDNTVSCLIQYGDSKNFPLIRGTLMKSLPEGRCHIRANKLTETALEKFISDLQETKDSNDNNEKNLFMLREERTENVLMVADDDMLVRKAVSSLLKPTGKVIETDNGDSVLEIYKENNPDIILLDIHMPGKTGLELIHDILELDPHAYIIVFSSDSVIENVIDALEKGAVGFLSKPPQEGKLKIYLQQCVTIEEDLSVDAL